MGHKFDVTKRRKLNSEERRRILPPIETLKKMGLLEGDIIADIGCGIGYFTFPASGIVGPKGLVYAMDISPEMLVDVEKKVSEQGILNIRTIQTEENDFKVTEETVTYAFISNVLHELMNPAGFLQEIKRLLSPNGRVGVLEWRKAETGYGPPVDHRLDIKEVKQMFEDLEFKNIQGIEIGEHFYSVTAQKNAD